MNNFGIQFGKPYKPSSTSPRVPFLVHFIEHENGKCSMLFHNNLIEISNIVVPIKLAAHQINMLSSREMLVICLYDKRLYVFDEYAKHFLRDMELVE